MLQQEIMKGTIFLTNNYKQAIDIAKTIFLKGKIRDLISSMKAASSVQNPSYL